MRQRSAVAASTLLVALVLVLAGCHTASSGGSASDSSMSSYTPSTGAFAAIPAPPPGPAVVNTCNLDAVNGVAPGSTPLQQGATATFSGWAAGADTGKVPPGVQLVLKGAQSYAVNIATGAARPDVAKASRQPGWTVSGYVVKADLSTVAPGTYTPVLEFSVNGKHMQCTTLRPVTVR